MVADEDAVRELADRLTLILMEVEVGTMTGRQVTRDRIDGALLALRGVLSGDLTAIPSGILAQRGSPP